MKLQAHDNTLETNAKLKSQDFGIADMSKIIEILRKHMYEHRVRSMCQEIMSNGRDAQREVGSKKRMIVSVPNKISPVFKVRDFGPGITPDRMANVFIQYGASTKTNTNSQTGGFGLGAKSPFAYGDSFTIVSITSGKKRTYVAHIGVNKQGRLDLLSTDNTDEENGTEIQVAVKPYDCEEFRQSIFRASYFWSDSERPEFRGVTALDVPKHNHGMRVGNLEIVKSLPGFIGLDSYSERCALIIDGIPYPVSRKLCEESKHLETLLEMVKPQVLIHIGNGVVEVSASRESIADSEVTRKALSDLGLEAKRELIAHVKAEFKAVKSNADWIKTYHKLSSLVSVDDHSSYGDYKIERGAITSELFSKVAIEVTYMHSGRRSRGKSKKRVDIVKFIPVDKVANVFVKDGSDSSVIQGRRVTEFLETNPGVSMVVLNLNIVAGQTTEKESKAALAKIVKDFGGRNLSSLPYTPITREARAKRDRTKEMFTIHVASCHGKSPRTQTLASLVSDNYKYLYVKFADYEKFEAEFKDLADFLDKDYGLCALTDASIEMVEGCELFSRYEDWKKEFKAPAALLKTVKGMKAKNIQAMTLLAKTSEKIKDKHVTAMLAEYKGLDGKSFAPETICKIVSEDVKSFLEDDKTLAQLLKETYPLVNTVADQCDWKLKSKDADELAFYINAKQ
jgi:hypothetical protein